MRIRIILILLRNRLHRSKRILQEEATTSAPILIEFYVCSIHSHIYYSKAVSREN